MANMISEMIIYYNKAEKTAVSSIKENTVVNASLLPLLYKCSYIAISINSEIT